MIEKQCTLCEETKNISEFHKNKDGRGGYRSQCKICINTKRKSTRDNNVIPTLCQRMLRYKNDGETKQDTEKTVNKLWEKPENRKCY